MPKSSKFCIFCSIRFCWNRMRYGLITYQPINGETLDFHVNVNNGDIKCPIGKSIFAINFPCYRCKCWHWTSKVSPYIIWYILVQRAGEIWTKWYGPKYTKTVWVFWQKHEFLKPFLTKRWRHFARCLLAETSLLNGKLLILRLLFSVVQK